MPKLPAQQLPIASGATRGQPGMVGVLEACAARFETTCAGSVPLRSALPSRPKTFRDDLKEIFPRQTLDFLLFCRDASDVFDDPSVHEKAHDARRCKPCWFSRRLLTKVDPLLNKVLSFFCHQESCGTLKFVLAQSPHL